MRQVAWRVVTSVNLAIMLAIFLLSVLLNGCDGMLTLENGNTTYMKCHWTFVANTILAAAGFIVGLVCEFARGTEGRRISAIVQLILYVALAVMPSPLGIGICASAEMECHFTAYATWGLCAAGAILSILQIAKANPLDAEKPKMKV